MRAPIEHDVDTGPTRPTGPAAPGERARAWLEWFGVSRLVTSAVAVVVVCVGAYWLARSPVPSPESTLPFATAAPTVPADGTGPPASAPGAGSPVAGGSGAPSAAGGEDGAVPRADEPATVVVHVAGAVVRPGVYELDGTARVDDAIAEAGGATGDADPEALNLAAPVVDGSRIHVPRHGEEVPAELVIAPPPPTDVADAPVDVNRATAERLETLPGVGPATAAAIVTERERSGPFASPADLERVPGIGPAKLAALERLVVT
ncbi:helix-hairpin-helix domain-containing protein [Ilumatobacter sp.]|uniref:helix-hairpin-helix domain-containing protein n=1 Tax=Ilumatobacter sp. TaxID=1967498 RepID=UPI003B52A801